MPLARGEILGYEALREFFHHCAMLRWGCLRHIWRRRFRADVVFVKPFLGQPAIFRVRSVVSKVKIGKPCNERGLQKLDMPDCHF